MQKRKSRVLSFLTAIAMACTMLPTAVFAADPGYTFDSGILTITTNDGAKDWRSDGSIEKTAVESVIVAEGVTKIPAAGFGLNMAGAFEGCSNLKTVSLPDTLTDFEGYSFRYCSSLESISIPANVIGIGVRTFFGCSSLTEVTIPAKVQMIGQDGLSGCSKLETVKVQSKTPFFLVTPAFENLPDDFIIYVPAGTADTYKAANGWKNYADHIIAEEPDSQPAPSTGGSSGGSGNGTAAAPAQKIVNTPTATKTSAANNTQTYRNYDVLTPDGAKTIAGKSTEVNFDKTVGNKVLSRITMNPADLAKAVTKNVKLGVHFDAKDKAVSAVASKLGKYFSNKMVLVTYDQKNVLSVNAEFAAKLDLSGLNTKTLYFYSYDSTTNKYAQVSAPNYFMDANGYVHFTAPFGGTVIITDSPLTK